ncbi:hypothetical protein [Burkholderia gladioli]|uniref:hypothetical protein n=1 Tax=Burkholderia gladioli TaxID=28095 RepID=UPI000D4AF085|nr:hypothetical protein [Burkholderia gladioli]PRH37741.1 hypothetical protein C6V07_01510 [Burkholderia gladioli]
MPYVCVEVEVDLDRFSTEDLLEALSTEDLSKELIKRKADAACRPAPDAIDQIYYAFYFGNTEDAMTLTKQMVQEATGRILPT